MADRIDKKTRSRVMASIRSKNTKPELWLFKTLDSAGIKYEKHVEGLPGKPDALVGKVAVFVEGDFWHGWNFPRWKHKLPPYWQKKIHRNRIRDRNNMSALRKRGFGVLRIWEHDIKNGNWRGKLATLGVKPALRR